MRRLKFVGLLTVIITTGLLFAGAALADSGKSPIYAKAELIKLFDNINLYMDLNADIIEANADNFERNLFNSIFSKVQGVIQYAEATEDQTSIAYRALLNGFIFLGMAVEWDKESDLLDRANMETLSQTSFQLLNEDYYATLREIGKTQDIIEQAKETREKVEKVYKSPQDFSDKEKKLIFMDAYREIYKSSMIMAFKYGKELPDPETYLTKAQTYETEKLGLPNPIVEVDSPDILSEMLGTKMPIFSDSLNCKNVGNMMIGEEVAQSIYQCGAKEVVIRLAPGNYDVSGIYGGDILENLSFPNSFVRINSYEKYIYAVGTLYPDKLAPYSFAIIAENLKPLGFRKFLEDFLSNY